MIQAESVYSENRIRASPVSVSNCGKCHGLRMLTREIARILAPLSALEQTGSEIRQNRAGTPGDVTDRRIVERNGTGRGAAGCLRPSSSGILHGSLSSAELSFQRVTELLTHSVRQNGRGIEDLVRSSHRELHGRPEKRSIQDSPPGI